MVFFVLLNALIFSVLHGAWVKLFFSLLTVHTVKYLCQLFLISVLLLKSGLSTVFLCFNTVKCMG